MKTPEREKRPAATGRSQKASTVEVESASRYNRGSSSRKPPRARRTPFDDEFWRTRELVRGLLGELVEHVTFPGQKEPTDPGADA